jgi:hypothetical protein
MVIEDFRNRILNDFSGLILVGHDTLLIGLGGLGDALTLAGELALVIEGMEGFRTDGVTLTPLVDFVADLTDIDGTWAERVQLSVEGARRVAAAWVNGPEFIELMLASQDE